jgi:cytochrome b6-f complex iron-sulfur subunit
MSDLNRRQFLIAAATTAAVISLPVLQAQAQDAPTTQPASKVHDVGTLKSYDKDGITDTWVKPKQGGFFVLREDGKLYACSSKCTHRGVTIAAQGDELVCPAHGSHFSVEGTVTAGPAKSSLPRYAISVDDNGHVLVDKSKQFTEVQWTDPASFVTIPA